MNHKVAVAISFIINLSIIVYAFIMHSNMYSSHTPTNFDIKNLIKAIEVFLYPALFICLPWFIAFLFKTKANKTAAYVFSVLSVCSCLLFFIPPPLHPSEAIGFVVVVHILVSYALLFICFLICKFAIPSNPSFKRDA